MLGQFTPDPGQPQRARRLEPARQPLHLDSREGERDLAAPLTRNSGQPPPGPCRSEGRHGGQRHGWAVGGGSRKLEDRPVLAWRSAARVRPRCQVTAGSGLSRRKWEASPSREVRPAWGQESPCQHAGAEQVEFGSPVALALEALGERGSRAGCRPAAAAPDRQPQADHPASPGQIERAAHLAVVDRSAHDAAVWAGGTVGECRRRQDHEMAIQADLRDPQGGISIYREQWWPPASVSGQGFALNYPIVSSITSPFPAGEPTSSRNLTTGRRPGDGVTRLHCRRCRCAPPSLRPSTSARSVRPACLASSAVRSARCSAAG